MKRRYNLIIIALSVVFLLAYVFLVDGAENILSLLWSVSKGWLLIALLAMVVYWLLEAIALHLITKRYYKKQKFSQTLHTSMIGQLFNCVTPFSSGGQPMQAVDMTQYGVPAGIASCSLLIKFIVYQFSLTILGAIVLIMKFSYFTHNISNFVYLVIIGFLVNFFVLAFLICIGFFKPFATKIVSAVITLLVKLHLIKNEEMRREQAAREIEAFHNGFEQIKHNKSQFIITFLISAVQIIVFSAIPYFIYLGFGLSGESVVTIICAQIFVSMITAFVPLPGAAGGAEVSFYMFFSLFFGSSVNAAVLLWRLFTFYLPILVGSLFYLKIGKRKQAAIPASSKTTSESERAG